MMKTKTMQSTTGDYVVKISEFVEQEEWKNPDYNGYIVSFKTHNPEGIFIVDIISEQDAKNLALMNDGIIEIIKNGVMIDTNWR